MWPDLQEPQLLAHFMNSVYLDRQKEWSAEDSAPGTFEVTVL